MIQERRHSVTADDGRSGHASAWARVHERFAAEDEARAAYLDAACRLRPDRPKPGPAPVVAPASLFRHVGRRFGTVVILSATRIRADGGTHVAFTVRCDCGRTYTVRAASILNQGSRRCRACYLRSVRSKG